MITKLQYLELMQLKQEVEENITQDSVSKSDIYKILLGIWLILFWFYFIASTAKLTRAVYGGLPQQMLIYPLILNGLIILPSFFLNFHKNRTYFNLLMIICSLTAYYMVKELINENMYRGWVFPDVKVTRTQYNKDHDLYYRFVTENYLQENKKSYFEFKQNPNSDFERSLLPYIPDIWGYFGNEKQFNDKGERLFPLSLRIGLVEHNDSLFFYFGERSEIFDFYYIEPNLKKIKYAGKKRVEILEVPADSIINSAANPNREIKVLKLFEEQDTTAIILNDSIVF